MTIATKMTFQQYLKLMYVLTYRKGWSIYLTVIGIIVLFGSIFNTKPSPVLEANAVYRWAFGIFVVVVIPISVYLTAKRNYNSNRRLQENITYEFSNAGLKITGESFNTEQRWEQTYKIEELKNWFLIYQSKQIANGIPKENLSPDQIVNIRNILRNIRVVKVKLKKP